MDLSRLELRYIFSRCLDLEICLSPVDVGEESGLKRSGFRPFLSVTSVLLSWRPLGDALCTTSLYAKGNLSKSLSVLLVSSLSRCHSSELLSEALPSLSVLSSCRRCLAELACCCLWLDFFALCFSALFSKCLGLDFLANSVSISLNLFLYINFFISLSIFWIRFSESSTSLLTICLDDLPEDSNISRRTFVSILSFLSLVLRGELSALLADGDPGCGELVFSSLILSRFA